MWCLIGLIPLAILLLLLIAIMRASGRISRQEEEQRDLDNLQP